MHRIRIINGPCLVILQAMLLTTTLLICAPIPLATVTSTGPFQVHGANVPADGGVPSWPIMEGDTVQAGSSAPVTVTFANGSVLVLEPGSSARIEMLGQTPVFRLEDGAAHYSLSNLSAVKLLALDDPVTPPRPTGSYSVHKNRKPGAGWWTAGHASWLLGGAAAAAALGYGVASAIRGGPPVSPIQ